MARPISPLSLITCESPCDIVLIQPGVPLALSPGPLTLSVAFDSGPLAGRLRADSTVVVVRPQH
jgi:hypothetical protein